MKKRLLALLLIVMMLVQTLPMNALATEASGALSGTEATRATI